MLQDWHGCCTWNLPCFWTYVTSVVQAELRCNESPCDGQSLPGGPAGASPQRLCGVRVAAGRHHSGRGRLRLLRCLGEGPDAPPAGPAAGGAAGGAAQPLRGPGELPPAGQRRCGVEQGGEEGEAKVVA